MTVAELLDRISGEELADWQAYELREGPLGPARGDWQAAVVALAIATANHRGKGKRPKLTDFLLKWTGGESKSDAGGMEALAQDLARMGLGTISTSDAAGG